MSCENRGNIDSSSFAERESNTGQPFVEMCNDSFVLLVGDELSGVSFCGQNGCLEVLTSPKNHATR